MLNYIFDFKIENDQKFVPYLMQQANGVVGGKMTFKQAMHVLTLSGKEIRSSDAHEGYPITSDDIYFFAGKTIEEAIAQKKSRRKKEVPE